MDQIDALKEGNYIDRDGKDIAISNFGIEFCHVDFGYEGNTAGRTVLKDVSFSIPEKTSTAIVGPSGSGKTTICNMIALFYDVQAGSIRMGGHDVREFTCDSLLKNMSMVFQNVYLFHDTIRNNIRFGKPDATEEEVIAAAKAARCHDFIVSLPQGYDTVVGEGGGTLSGGEKQRISIARAMLKNAPVTILDEDTASIDPENEHLIQEPPHVHILLTIHPLDDNGGWGAKCRKVYDLDKNGKRIPDGKGGYKNHREDTTDWNDKGNAERWRAAWAAYANKALDEHLSMWEQYEKNKSIRRQLDKVKPRKKGQFEQKHGTELALYEAAARYLEKLKSGGEAVTPKKWRAESEKLAAQKEIHYQEMRTMREQIKAVENLRKAADQLERSQQDRNRKKEDNQL